VELEKVREEEAEPGEASVEKVTSPLLVTVG
jgi:hypothetical protein